MNGEKHTFICYARQDKEFARKLANGLRQNGVGIWMDVLDIPAGVRWDRAVEKALRKAERLLVILSPDAVESENVQDELAFAFDRKKPIVPVRFRACEIPFRLLRLQYIDFTGDYDTALQELLASLGVEPITHDPNAEEIERLFGEAQAEMARESWPAAIGSLKAVLALDASHAQANAALQQAAH
ncbi:MAG: toll/interleukin-1 receptor domain-containing protein [bacterium]